MAFLPSPSCLVAFIVGQNGRPDLTIAKTHIGDFTLGQSGAVYTIVVKNIGTGTTTSAVSVIDDLPFGLTASAIAGVLGKKE